MSYCEKHELSNCAECSGAAARFDNSLGSDPIPESDDVLPLIYGATVIKAKYGGTCTECGRRFAAQDIIWMYRGEQDAWKGYICCASSV